MKNIEYRYDIQVLRGIAVLLVMVFHANPNWLPGGFLGVDIFFTISGFVIFRLINHELENGKFNIINFYRKRVTRLFPALFVTITATLIISAIYLPQDSLKNIISSSIWSVVSLPNIYFFLDSGYFSADSIEKPLLHLWSLGVEEQFYLLFPALAILMAKENRGTNIIFLTLLTLAGVLISQYYTTHNPTAAFYLTPLRTFQFTIGALVVLLPQSKITTNNALYIWWALIFIALLMCGTLFTENTPLPGTRAFLLSVVIASLLYLGNIVSGQSKIIRSKAIQFTGDTSYSLYLAHWPVAVIFQYQFAGSESTTLSIAILLTGFFLGLTLHFIIEKPMRKKPFKNTLFFPVSTCMIIAIFTLTNIQQVDTPNKVLKSKLETSVTRRSSLPPRSNIIDKTIISPLMLIGDSHAAMYKGLIEEISSDKSLINHQVYQGCLPTAGIYKIYTRQDKDERTEHCANLQTIRKHSIDSFQPEIVILSARWEFYHTDKNYKYPQPGQDWLVKEIPYKSSLTREKNIALLDIGIQNRLSELKDTEVILIGQVPLQRKESVRCANREVDHGKLSDFQINKKCSASKTKEANKNYATIHKLFETLKSENPQITYIDPMKYLCRKEYCQLVRDGKRLYKDDNHLSEAGSKFVLLDSLQLMIMKTSIHQR